jgi:hypothetical protein
MQTVGLAERFQVEEVRAVLEDALAAQLSVDTCAEVLSGSWELGLGRAAAAAERLALERFEEVAATEGFLEMEEEALERLLDDDDLEAEREECVLECVARWIAGGDPGGDAEGPRGRGLLAKVRFQLMAEEYLLAGEAERRVPAEHRAWVRGAVEEALRVKAAAAAAEGEGVLPPAAEAGPSQRAARARVRQGVSWERCGGGGGARRLPLPSVALAIVECGGRVCCGCGDGTIVVQPPPPPPPTPPSALASVLGRSMNAPSVASASARDSGPQEARGPPLPSGHPPFARRDPQTRRRALRRLRDPVGSSAPDPAIANIHSSTTFAHQPRPRDPGPGDSRAGFPAVAIRERAAELDGGGRARGPAAGAARRGPARRALRSNTGQIGHNPRRVTQQEEVDIGCECHGAIEGSD